MKIKVWGCRGSIPTPSTANFVTSRFGGNTTCLSIRIPGQIVILDGGSGLRNLGLELAQEKPLKATFFFSHVHWDHIQGFPFFVPCFMPGNTFDLWGPKYRSTPETLLMGSILENALRWQQRSLNFPVQLKSMPSQLSFQEICTGQTVEIQGTESKLSITAEPLQHPGGCMGYRIEEHRGSTVKTFAFCTDTEHLDIPNPSIQKLAKDCDVLFHDAQYTVEEYEGKGGLSRKGWGHSTWQHALREAIHSKAKRLLLTHHDPMDDDWMIARIENQARHEGLKLNIPVDSAFEGMEFEL